MQIDGSSIVLIGRERLKNTIRMQQIRYYAYTSYSKYIVVHIITVL